MYRIRKHRYKNVRMNYLKSLLFYFDMLSIQGVYQGDTILSIPNLTVRQQLYTYLTETCSKTSCENNGIRRPLCQNCRSAEHRLKAIRYIKWLFISWFIVCLLLNYFSPIGKKHFSNRENNMPVYITSFPNVTNAGAMIKLLFFLRKLVSYLQLFPALHGICHHFCYLCFVEH